MTSRRDVEDSGSSEFQANFHFVWFIFKETTYIKKFERESTYFIHERTVATFNNIKRQIMLPNV